jgi:hypothetical protein
MALLLSGRSRAPALYGMPCAQPKFPSIDADDTETNALDPEAFERMLHDRWAVSRRDIYVGAIAPPRSLDASEPTRPLKRSGDSKFPRQLLSPS